MFLPFKNESDYKGRWKLENDLPNYIAAYLREAQNLKIMSASSFESLLPENLKGKTEFDIEYIETIAKEYNYLYAITGVVQTFNIERYNFAEPSIMGYEYYNCSLKIEYSVIDVLTSSIIKKETIQGNTSRNSLGITLYGRIPEDKQQFYGLDNIKFGSEDFGKTIVGETMNSSSSDFLASLSNEQFLKNCNKETSHHTFQTQDIFLDSIKVEIKTVSGMIVSYDALTGEAFINLGSNDKIKTGDILFIMSPDTLIDPVNKQVLGIGEDRVAELQIKEIRTERLSLGIVLNNREKVKKNLIVRKNVFN